VEPERIYVDHGLTGAHRDRPGLRRALAACRAGDTLVVTKLDRLARSLPDAPDIADELTARDVKLALGTSRQSPDNVRARLIASVHRRGQRAARQRGQRPIGHLTPHTLRRTFMSILAELGVAPRRAMYLAAHRPAFHDACLPARPRRRPADRRAARSDPRLRP
jgi:integrase